MDLDRDKLPRHLAVIMDGNGRWARQRNLPRIEGHRRGAETVDEIVEECREIGIPYLTLYAFSMENWGRPQEEIDALMALLREFLITKRPKLLKNEIRMRSIGDISRLPESVLSELKKTEQETAACDKMTLVLALSYGGRDEIVRAVNRILAEKEKGSFVKPEITAADLAEHLDACDIPDPDLIIRTSGETRSSNFLLWQTAYAEFIFTETLWPDFHKDNLLSKLSQFQQRERRFGQTSDQIQSR
jgi:undecaprenyl diphosphate synthase